MRNKQQHEDVLWRIFVVMLLDGHLDEAFGGMSFD